MRFCIMPRSVPGRHAGRPRGRFGPSAQAADSQRVARGGRFALQYRPFRSAKWPILRCEMAYIGKRFGRVCPVGWFFRPFPGRLRPGKGRHRNSIFMQFRPAPPRRPRSPHALRRPHDHVRRAVNAGQGGVYHQVVAADVGPLPPGVVPVVVGPPGVDAVKFPPPI